MLVSWLTFRAGISLPIIGGIGNMLTSFEYLLIARYRIFRGLKIKFMGSARSTKNSNV